MSGQSHQEIDITTYIIKEAFKQSCLLGVLALIFSPFWIMVDILVSILKQACCMTVEQVAGDAKTAIGHCVSKFFYACLCCCGGYYVVAFIVSCLLSLPESGEVYELVGECVKAQRLVDMFCVDEGVRNVVCHDARQTLAIHCHNP